jgi:ATP-dependent RNA helicase DeaD
MTTFKELGISEPVIKAMKSMGWTEPTPVQIASVPYGLEGHDLFAQAQTGTGKTAAYTSIILGRIDAGYETPSALILTPTRELAIQVSEEIDRLSQFTDHICTVIYGGVSMTPQITRLKKGTDIVVGTPGRIKDLVDQGVLDLSWISVVVLDEADRMLDMGFIRDLDYILKKIPEKRQMLMFSATMTPEINKLAKSHMKNPKEFLVSKDEPVLDLISQYYVMTDKDSKRLILRSILDKGNPRTIAFCHTKRKASQIAKKMINDGYVAAALHGDVPQAKREKVIRAFRDGSIDLLIATDVAARGLDIDDVEYVVNYDMPNDPETYVHRIGRVGRAGRTGVAVSFVLSDEKGMIKDIQKVTGKKIELMTPDISKYIEGQKVKETVQKAHAKPAENKKKRPEPAKKAPVKTEPVTLQIDIGSDKGMSKSKILEIITTNTGVLAKDVGSIIVGKKASFVEVRTSDSGKLVPDVSKQAGNAGVNLI